jgi:hypothetical protein
VQSYSQRLRIWETNYGRDTGWILEREGKPIATLSDCQFEDMFWDSYRIDPITDDRDIRQMILSEAFWTGSDWIGLTWRNRELEMLPVAPFPAVSPMREPGRVVVRGLYISIAEPRWWDRVVLWVRRRRRGAARKSVRV